VFSQISLTWIYGYSLCTPKARRLGAPLLMCLHPCLGVHSLFFNAHALPRRHSVLLLYWLNKSACLLPDVSARKFLFCVWRQESIELSRESSCLGVLLGIFTTAVDNALYLALQIIKRIDLMLSSYHNQKRKRKIISQGK
jgi:hypothetical protein